MNLLQYMVKLAKENRVIAHLMVHRPTALFPLLWFFMVAYFVVTGDLQILNWQFIFVGASLYFSFAFIATTNSLFDRAEDIESAKINKFSKSGYIGLLLSDKELKIHSVAYAAASLAIAYYMDIKLAGVALALIVGAFLYSAEPFRFKSRPFLDIATYFIGGFLIPISSIWAVWGILNLQLILFSLLSASFVAAAWPVSQSVDYEADKKCSVKTTLVALGLKKAATIGLLFGFVTLVIGAWITYLFTPFALFMPIFVVYFSALFKFYKTPAAGHEALVKTLGYRPYFIAAYTVAATLSLLALTYLNYV